MKRKAIRSNVDNQESKRKIRFGVIGLGYISQVAVLPAFAHAKNCELKALISGDPEKLRKLGKKYKVPNLIKYSQYKDYLRSGEIDAIYIALPNSMHHHATLQAAQAGIHVLCEKPMATTESECREMLQACERHRVKLMIAYRLHFEKANLSVLDAIQAKEIGEPRVFNSTFCMQVAKENSRTKAELGGGALWDIGIYCINAARSFFNDEPRKVTALISNPKDGRFKEIDGLCGAILEFGPGRIASFVTSLGAADIAHFHVVGSEGRIELNNAYEYASPMTLKTVKKEKERSKKFGRRDQFAPELIHFADCILNDKEPIPSGWEGLADVRVIEALYESAAVGRTIPLSRQNKVSGPAPEWKMEFPAVEEPRLIDAQTPSVS